MRTTMGRLAAGSLAMLLVLGGCARTDLSGRSPDGQPTGPTTTCNYPSAGQPAKPVDPPSAQAPTEGSAVVTMQMAAGRVTMTLDRTKAPCAVHSLESLVQQGYFDATRCHRLVDQGIFILQCGDPTGTGRGGPGYTFADELTGQEKYPKGTIAMANAGPDTNGSQFFLVWADTELKPDYTVIGRMDEESLRTVGKIASQGVDGKAAQEGAPIADTTITSVTLG